MDLEQQYSEAEAEFMKQQERFYNAGAERIRAEDAMTAARKRLEYLEKQRRESPRSPGCSTATDRAITELAEAIDFMDRVRTASEDDRIAVGSDHWNWLESAARKVVASR